MKNKIKKIICYYSIVPFFLFSLHLSAQVVVTSMTPQQLVQNILVGSGVSVSNIHFTGSLQAIGKFTGAGSIGIPVGVILTTGKASDAVGPNSSGSNGEDLSQAGNVDLDALSGVDTYDAAILEFDFIPSADTIRFNYVFGSEEYNEFVCSDMNDIFAFFLTGPNPIGTAYNKTNIALIPGTNTPVAINSVNVGSPGGSYSSSGCTDKYGSNALNHSNFFNANVGSAIQYDGYTDVFQAMAVVTPCQTYTIRIAIADGGDGVYDSGVFLQAKSFSSPSLNLTAVSSTGDSTMAEGCGAATYYFSRGGIINDTLVIHYTIGGSASNGVDYVDSSGNPIIDSVVFYPGEDTVSIIIDPKWDGITENDETIVLTIPQVLSCVTVPISATIYLLNVDSLKINVNNDTAICDGNSFSVGVTPLDGIAPFTYLWSTNQTTPSFVETPAIGTYIYSVEVTDSCGNFAEKSFELKVNPIPTSTFDIPDEICVLQEANIIYTGNAPSNANFSWNFGDGSIESGSGGGPYQIKWNLEGGKNVSLFVTSLGCSSIITIDSINLINCPLTIPNVFTPNGDGLNDNFEIINIEYYSNYTLLVFNRWGKKVLESTNYKNDWNGDKSSDGTYYYILQINEGENYTGTVTIMR
ncbi:MAG: choice-of-anchor L domain-containing protein [Bacteroidota bacterium]